MSLTYGRKNPKRAENLCLCKIIVTKINMRDEKDFSSQVQGLNFIFLALFHSFFGWHFVKMGH